MPHCPTDTELLRLALTPEGSESAAGAPARHVAECARCQRELDELRDAVAGLRAGDAPGADGSAACLDDDAIATLAEGFPDGRAPQLDLVHLAGCAHCRARVAGVSQLLRNAQVAAEVRHLEAAADGSGTRKRWLPLAGGLAATALLVLAVRSSLSRRHDVQLREEPVTLIAAPVPLQPIGIVARVDLLSWHAVPRATQYRVTLFAQDGSTVWETSTADTVVTLAPGTRLAPGAVYYWKVEARTDWNRWTASELVDVRIGARP